MLAMGVLKNDYTPILAPGRHYVTLAEVEALCVTTFEGAARDHREQRYLGLEQLVQSLLAVKLPCSLIVDGSFFTKKPQPDDLDVVVSVDYDVSLTLTEEQRQVLDQVNEENSFQHLDSTAFFNYPIGHECFGCAFDANLATEGYGIEHSKAWLKGYAVLRLMETDVGLRICR